MKGLALALLIIVAVAAANVQAEQGPYDDIQDLLKAAKSSSLGLASLDSRGAPRIIEVVHNHDHFVPHDMPAKVAEKIAEDNTPKPKPIRIVAIQNRAQKARHAKEDRQHAKDIAQQPITTVDVKQEIKVSVPINLRARAKAAAAANSPSNPTSYTIKGQRGDSNEDKDWKVQGTGFHFPLVDRRLQQPTFSIIADTDGSDKANPDWKPHTATELQAEAAKLLQKAKLIQDARAAREEEKKKIAAENASLGMFSAKDDSFEDELTQLKRVAARMNRLHEQIDAPHPGDSFEGSIARKQYFLKIYEQLKNEVTQIVESYALRTGNSIFSMFGDGKIDPSIAAFLPPNSVAGILAKYTNPTMERDDETARDVVSGKDAKRIQYSIDYFNAKAAGAKLPMPPKFAPTDEEIAAEAKHNDIRLNKVVATQEGEFGQNRPAVTIGDQAIGRSSVHLSVVNPSETQSARGVPVQVNLKAKAPSKKLS